MIKNYSSNLKLVQFAVRSLQSHPQEEVLEYLPQLLQALRVDVTHMVEEYLIFASLASPIIAHRLIWLIQAEGKDPDDTPHGPPSKLPPNPKDEEFSKLIENLRETIINRMDKSSKQFYQDEFAFFGRVNAISGILKPIGQGLDKAAQEEDRKQKITSELKKIGAPPANLYLPTSHSTRVVGIVVDSGITLQSAAKVPILIVFKVSNAHSDNPTSEHKVSKASSFIFGRKTIRIMKKTQTGQKKSFRPLTRGGRKASQLQLAVASAASSVHPPEPLVRLQACIFKVGDDCRQDQLALQMIRCFRNAFEKIGLGLYVYPYNVVSTKPGCGVIEVVPRTKSLDQLGKGQENFLYDYFINTYGREDQLTFQTARRNFVDSMAAYSIVSYILQIKDRHNGNILLDDDGHVIHIDFGFIFEISPGGNIKFEMAPFKLTGEMIHLMGGPQSTTYQHFRTLCVKAYLAVRHQMNEVVAIAGAMSDSGLGCFKAGAIANLKSRFKPNLTERQAADHVRELVIKSESHITTHVYDLFQSYSQGIAYK